MKFRDLFKGIEDFTGYSLCLNEIRKNPAASFARFHLNFVPFMKYAG